MPLYSKIIRGLLIITITKSFCQFVYGQEGLLQNNSVVNSLHHTKHKKITQLEIPKTEANDNVISHTGFSFLYNETHEQSVWVAYELTEAETNKIYERTNDFIPDPSVITGTANNNDFRGSGYDRGHLAPASDMGWSEEAMIESFYFSNMSPQLPSFNRGIWKKLEELVRTWAIENESVYIVTGPVLNSIEKTIGQNKVSVPNYYYKVVLDYNEPEIKAIGFIMPNMGSNESLTQYAVSVDSVEYFTGIDFFPLLPDDQEKHIEKNVCVNCWTWKSQKNMTNKTTLESEEREVQDHLNEKKETEKKSPSENTVQCSAYTKSGKRCKRMTTNANGKCFQHE